MKWNNGDVVHGFNIMKVDHVEEVNSDVYMMEHIKSGAKLMYLDSADDNKVFYICFRTTPDNSKGTPHIMEHSTLCGSRKFPLKEPFVELAKGSLNTFLNAMTWPDKTMYPVASRNSTDFHNLMDVYLDAVFYPDCLQNPQILMQEGWHYELDKKDGELTYNGVVYNEMKGALSSPDALLNDAAMEKLFPDTTYSVESGGDPDVIPTLSFREFTDFHRRFYHPSNSYIYLYGDMDIENTLKYIDEEYLSAFDRRCVYSEVGTQKAFAKRVITEKNYNIADGENIANKAIHALYAAMTDCMTTKESLAIRILNYVLIDMDGAPLKKALLDAGVGSDVSGAYEDSYKQPVWSIVVTGSEPERQGEFSQIVDHTLRKLALTGLDKKMLTAALNRTEFILRENDYQGRPKGLFYGIRAMDMWLYDRDPIEALRYYDDINGLRKAIETDYFEGLLLKYLIKNPHQVLITMKAKKGIDEKKRIEVAEQLDAYKKSLSENQITDIIEKTRVLKERQASVDSEEALTAIPLLRREDLNREIENDEIENGRIEGIRHFHYDINSNGIVYLNLYFNLEGLSKKDIFYANILTRLILSVNTVNYEYSELVRQSNAYTGGINFQVGSISNIDSDQKCTPYLIVKGKALVSNADKMVRLLKEVILHTDYTDKIRLREILMEEKANWDMTAFARGHTLCISRLLSYFSEAGRYSETTGLSYYYFLSDVVARFDAISDEMISCLQRLAKQIFTRHNLFIHTIGSEEEKTAVNKFLPEMVSEMPEELGPANRETTCPNVVINEAFQTAGKVQYVAKGGNFKRHGFAYTGALRVMETILRYEYLWKKVRVLGGAYGAFTQFMRNGNAVLCSYRDPNLAETLKVYEELPDYLSALVLSEREMTKYVIGTMAAEEIQLTPFMKGERALAYYLTGNTRESRMKIRDEIVNCTIDNIRSLAPLVRSVMNDPYICVMGNEEKIRQNKALFTSILSMPK